MSIIIKPKNIFDRSINKLNDNNITSASFLDGAISQDWVSIFDENDVQTTQFRINSSDNVEWDDYTTDIKSDYYYVQSGYDSEYGNYSVIVDKDKMEPIRLTQKTYMCKNTTYDFYETGNIGYDYSSFVDYEVVSGVKVPKQGTAMNMIYFTSGAEEVRIVNYDDGGRPNNSPPGPPYSKDVLYWGHPTGRGKIWDGQNIKFATTGEIPKISLGYSNIVYYSASDGDLAQFIVDNCGTVSLIINLDETNNSKISLIEVFRIYHKESGATYPYQEEFLETCSSGLEIRMYKDNTISEAVSSADYVLPDNEFSYSLPVYHQQKTVTNSVAVSGVSISGVSSRTITVTSAQNVASNITVYVKSTLFSVEYYPSQLYFPATGVNYTIYHAEDTEMNVLYFNGYLYDSAWYGESANTIQIQISSGSNSGTGEYPSSLVTISTLEIVDIIPRYDNTYVYWGSYEKPLNQHLAQKTVQAYRNGKQTAVLECSIDDYYDEHGNKVVSKRGESELPITFSNNCIVYPKRVRMQESVVDGKTTYQQQEVDFSNGKQFRVVGVKVKYDGAIMQELTLQEEKTQ